MVAIMLQELSLFSTNAIYWKTCCFIQGILIPVKLIARALDHLPPPTIFFQGIPGNTLFVFGWPCQPWFWGTQLEQKSEFSRFNCNAACIHEIVAPASLTDLHSYHFLNFRWCMVQLRVRFWISIATYTMQQQTPPHKKKRKVAHHPLSCLHAHHRHRAPSLLGG